VEGIEISSHNIAVFLVHYVQDEGIPNKLGKITYPGSRDITENINA